MGGGVGSDLASVCHVEKESGKRTQKIMRSDVSLFISVLRLHHCDPGWPGGPLRRHCRLQVRGEFLGRFSPAHSQVMACLRDSGMMMDRQVEREREESPHLRGSQIMAPFPLLTRHDNTVLPLVSHQAAAGLGL